MISSRTTTTFEVKAPYPSSIIISETKNYQSKTSLAEDMIKKDGPLRPVDLSPDLTALIKNISGSHSAALNNAWNYGEKRWMTFNADTIPPTALISKTKPASPNICMSKNIHDWSIYPVRKSKKQPGEQHASHGSKYLQFVNSFFQFSNGVGYRAVQNATKKSKRYAQPRNAQTAPWRKILKFLINPESSMAQEPIPYLKWPLLFCFLKERSLLSSGPPTCSENSIKPTILISKKS